MTLTAEHLNNQITQLNKKYEQGKGQLALLKSQKSEKEDQLMQTKLNLHDWKLVSILFTETSEFAREQLKSRIEKTVTAALQSIIEDSEIRFKVKIDQKGGQPVAEWKIVSPYGGELVNESPEDSRGGGISDIVSIALRLSLLELAKPKSEGILIADEPGKHVSAEYAPNLATFLQEYSEKTGRAIIMTTHNRDLAERASKHFIVGRDSEGNSEVTSIDKTG